MKMCAKDDALAVQSAPGPRQLEGIELWDTLTLSSPQVAMLLLPGTKIKI